MSISKMNLKERSLLFAKLASIAYCNFKDAKKQAKKLGFGTIEFYDRDGAQAYRFQNAEDLVIACRGTEPTEFNDLAADLNAAPVKSWNNSRVHKGFQTEVDDLWPMVEEDLLDKKNINHTLWFCGHSLGAAMATIMASRCWANIDLNDPIELYTYGSPRVGWRGFVKALAVKHHRWVNNNDIVTRVPLAIMGYVHDGEEHYMNAYGNVRELTMWQRFKDRWRGIWMGLKKGGVDSFSDHSMGNYIANLEKWQD